MKLKIKKGDMVKVITGADRGKTAKILKVFPELNKVLVEGISMRKKHIRARQGGQKGQVIEKAMPIALSNVMVLDPKTNKPTRVGKKLVGDKWMRVARKSDAVLDK